MKKIILLTACIATFSAAYCQYFTVKLGGGYSWGGLQQSTGVLTFQPGQSTDPAYASIIPLTSFSTSVLDTPASKQYKSNVYAGYGKGGHFDFSFGYMFNPYFGIQLDGAYLWGSSISAYQYYDAGGVLGNGVTINTTTHSNGLSVNPSLVFRAAKATAKFAPYARLGLALPISGAIYHTLNVQAPNSLLGDVTSSTIDVKTEATVSLGFQGSAGVSYTPFPLMTFWGEVNGQYLFVKAKQSTLTAYTLNIAGQSKTTNLLPTLSTYSIITNFVDQLTPNSNSQDFGKQRATGNPALSGTPGYVNESAAHDELRQVANLGAFGFTVGVTFNMSKKIFQDPFGKKKSAETNKVTYN